MELRVLQGSPSDYILFCLFPLFIQLTKEASSPSIEIRFAIGNYNVRLNRKYTYACGETNGIQMLFFKLSQKL